MTTLLDLPALRQPGPTGADAWPDDTAVGTSRLLLIERDTPRPVHDARLGALAAAWDWHLPEDVTEDLRQIVDALVSNAIVHAAWSDDWPAVSITLTLHRHALVVEVRDPDPTVPVWPGATRVDIAALIDDPTIDPDAAILTHRQGLADVAGRAELGVYGEVVGKCVRAVLPLGGAR